jgi:two-component system phosphate regulon response regulator PhoB
VVARIKAVMRRSSPTDEDGRIKLGDIVLDSNSRQVFFKGKDVHIGPTEYRLLAFFMTHNGRAYSRAQLLDNVWGANAFLEERTVDVHIRRLRKLLATEELDQYVQTVRGHGYRFLADKA